MLKDQLTGVELPDMLKAVAAYADDTAIICEDNEDLIAAGKCLERYEAATGMRKNKCKTEVVSNDDLMLKTAKEMGFATPTEVKYLGCPVWLHTTSPSGGDC